MGLKKSRFYLFSIVTVGLFLSFQITASELTILHTNDWQSRFLGFGPNSNFTPFTLNDDQTSGGVSRLASLIEQQRQAAGKGNTLLLDAGDYSMGTLFHTIIRETGSELQLFSALKYDAITFGNHEFDYHPEGLAQSINSAIAAGAKLPAIVVSNMVFSDDDPADDTLEELWKKRIIQPYLIINRGDRRIGIIGLLGYNAIDVTPNAKPVTFSDPVETATKLVSTLRNEEKVDLIIVLSHGGVLPDKGSSMGWSGDDLTLLESVPGIDIIIGGHSHTPLPQPLVIGDQKNRERLIVQAGSEVQYLGELKLDTTKKKIHQKAYVLHNINDSIAGDVEIQSMIDGFKDQVSQKFLATTDFNFDQELAETSTDLGRLYHQNTLGNLVSDAILTATDADIVINANGAIRDDIIAGQDGKQWVADLFRVVPMGVGTYNDKPGYDLMKVWVTGKEIKNMIEVMLLALKVRGHSYYPRIAGFKVRYNPQRVVFDQVSEIRIGNEQTGYKPVDLSISNKKLYSMGLNSYVGSLMWLIEDISYGLLNITPRDESGNIITDFRTGIYDSDPYMQGIQEVKEWRAFIEYISKLPDIDNDGLVDLPIYGNPRIVGKSSFHPIELFRNSTWIMAVATVFFCITILLILLSFRYIYRRITGTGAG